MSRTPSRPVAILIAIALLLGVAGWMGYHRIAYFRVKAPDVVYPAPSSALDAQRQDLDYFGRLMALDRSYSPAARQAAKRRLAVLEALPDPLPIAKLQVALMQIIALADNGHSHVGETREKGIVWTEPVRVTRFAEGFFVMRAKPPYRAMLSGRVESIDGVPFAKVLSALETLRGGTESFREENAARFIVLPDVLYGLGVTQHARSAQWTVRLPDGQLVTQTLVAEPLPKGASIPTDFRWLSPEPLKADGGDWISYQPSQGTLPESLRNDDDHFALFPVAGTCAEAVRLQSIADDDGQKIGPFLESAAATLRRLRPCAVIVDLRGNGGGDYTNTWHFAHQLPGLVAPGGRIYVLTDAGTFSAAISTAGFLKNADGDRVVIVGQQAGDRLTFYSEGNKGCLPHSGICVFFQLAKHDYGQQCRGRDCFWLDWMFPVRVQSYGPDVLIPRRFTDWNTGHDAPYEWCASTISSQSAPAPEVPAARRSGRARGR
jgi:hypothetical protein